MALSALNQIPIAELRPEIQTADSIVHGIVTLIWPYSSVTHTFSFLLVEPDFRLRRSRGQVRISLKGSCARRVTRAGLVSGDEVRLALVGAQWKKDETVGSTPGRGIEWELIYTDNLRLERTPEGDDTRLIDTSRMSASPEPFLAPPSTSPAAVAISTTPQATPKRETIAREAVNSWSSPIFLKDRRLPDIFPLKGDLAEFGDEEGWASGPPAKKLRFGRKSDQWRFVDRTPSPEPAKGGTVEEQVPSLEKVEQQTNGANHIADETTSPGAVAAEAILDAPDVDKTGGEADVETQSSLPITQEASVPPVAVILDKGAEARPAEEMPFMSIESTQIAYPSLESISTGPTGNGDIPDIATPIFDTVESFTVEAELQDAQKQSFDYTILSSPRLNLSPPRQRAMSRTPEPELRIFIRDATPLPPLVTVELQPDTPRLQPLPSPGLDIVSPIEARKTSRTSYFEAAFLQRTMPPANDESFEALAAERSPLSQAKMSEDESVESFTTNDALVHDSKRQSDTLLNKLSDQYNQASSLESGTTPTMDANTAAILDTYIQIPELLASDSHLPVPGDETTNQANPVPSEYPRNTAEIVEIIEEEPLVAFQDTITYKNKDMLERNAAIVSDQVSPVAETVEVLEDENSPSAEEEDSVRQGKKRDIIYYSSFKNSVQPDLESPLLTDHLEPVQASEDTSILVDSEDDDQPTLPELDSRVPDQRLVQDPYAVENELDQDLQQAITRDAAEVEIVDLLESQDSGADIEMEQPPSKARVLSSLLYNTQHVEENQQDDLMPDAVTQRDASPSRQLMEGIDMSIMIDDGGPTSIASPATVVHEAADPGGATQVDSSMENPVTNGPVVQAEDDAEFQSQNFYTAPASKQLESATLDLQIVPEDDILPSTEPFDVDKLVPAPEPQAGKPVTRIRGESRAKELPKSSQTSQRAMRSSKRVTRSQSQQIVESSAGMPQVEEIQDSQPDPGLTRLSTKSPSHQLQLEPISSFVAELSPKPKSTTSEDTMLLQSGFRTEHDYYTTLPTLSEFYHSITSVLAIVAAATKPIRAATGPRDHTQTLYLCGPHLPEDTNFIIAQLFRPFVTALPGSIPSGAVILLKDFKVQSYKRKISLLSTETSAWAIFTHEGVANQSEMTVSVTGPPVLFGASERGVAWGLGQWWKKLDPEIKTKVTAAANEASSMAEAELEKKSAAADAAAARKRNKHKLDTPATPSNRRQTRSEQNHSQIETTTIPNTPATPKTSPSTRKTRASQQAEAQQEQQQQEQHDRAPTKVKARGGKTKQKAAPNALNPNQEEEFDSQNESIITLDTSPQPSSSTTNKRTRKRKRQSQLDSQTESHRESDSQLELEAESQGQASTQRRTTRSNRRQEKWKGGSSSGMWHALRDGSIYKD